MVENLALRDFLAENYSTHAEVKELWKRVGGNTSRILDQTDSRSRWTALTQQMESGAIPRLKLLTEILKDYPGSAVLLNELAQQLSLSVLTPAKQLVEQVSRTDALKFIDIDFTVLNELKADEIAPAIAVQVFQSTPEEQHRFKLNLDTLKEKGTEAVMGAAAGALITGLIEGARLVFGA